MITPLAIACSPLGKPLRILSNMANRHGLIAGATGTGKTITLRKIAETFSNQGIPVFLVDVKGDLSGIVQAGESNGKIGERITELGLTPNYLQGFPVRFWDIYGETGIPIRISIEDMGVLLLSRLMNLNDAQEGVLNLVFRVAQDNDWRLIDIQDLRSMLQYVLQNRFEYQAIYGNVTSASIGAIQRQLLQLESERADLFFGLPELNLQDWLQCQEQQGIINILNAEKLIYSPRLYSAFMLWFLAKLFEMMPEVGDTVQPKFIMFFDEAHLMFDNAAPALLKKIEQIVRLIRSKGVGIYFVTQNPLDIPENIVGQLGNRVQHALRTFTPRDKKVVRDVAETFRSNPNLNVVQAISELSVGEALVSFLDHEGSPSMVQRTFIIPPQSQLTPLSSDERPQYFKYDKLYSKYVNCKKIFSAFDAIQKMAEQSHDEQEHINSLNTTFPPSIPLTDTSIPPKETFILQKGHNVHLNKLSPDIKEILVNLNWHTSHQMDIDVSVFMVNEDKRVPKDDYFIFYNQSSSPCLSTKLINNTSLNQNSKDIWLQLANIPLFIKSIIFAVTIHDADIRRQNFGQVSNAFVRLVNHENGQEVLRFDLSEDYSTETAMVFGEVYRHHGDWKFRAIGQGYSGGLLSLCQQYGVNVG